MTAQQMHPRNETSSPSTTKSPATLRLRKRGATPTAFSVGARPREADGWQGEGGGGREEYTCEAELGAGTRAVEQANCQAAAAPWSSHPGDAEVQHARG